MVSDPIALAAAAAEWVARSMPRRRTSSASRRPAAPRRTSSTRRWRRRRSASSIDWQRWHVFFGDERAVPPDDAQSNYRLLADTLLSKVAVPPEQVHRMEAERPDLDAAAAAVLAPARDRCGAPPRLDLVLLGLGTDGHTASLFPGTPALDVTDAWAARGQRPGPASRAPHPDAAGDQRRGARRLPGHRRVQGRCAARRHRRQRARGPGAAGRGELLWFLDAAAARSLD